jgi:uncharacterized OsmC-like protein
MKVTLNHSENLHFTASARDFKMIHIDEPESFHGTNLGPSPIEYLLMGIGGCISSSFVFCLKKKGVELAGLDVIVDGTLKHVGPKMNLRLVNVELDLQISLKEEESNEKIDMCQEIFKENCPISDLITEGVPLKIRISKKNIKS